MSRVGRPTDWAAAYALMVVLAGAYLQAAAQSGWTSPSAQPATPPPPPSNAVGQWQPRSTPHSEWRPARHSEPPSTLPPSWPLPPARELALPGVKATPTSVTAPGKSDGPLLPPPSLKAADPEPDEEVITKPPTPLNKPAPPVPPAVPIAPSSPSDVAQPPSAEADVDLAILLGSARNAYRIMEYEEAVNRFEQYLARRPQDRDVRREYAGVLVLAGKLEKSIEEFRGLIAKEPDNMVLRTSLADVFTQGQRFKDAVNELRLVIAREPNNIAAIIKLGRNYAFDGDLGNARAVYDLYLSKVAPGEARVTAEFAAFLTDIERPHDALRYLEPLRNKNPDDLEIYAEFVRAYADMGDKLRAIETIARMSQIAPKDLLPRRRLADALFASDDFELAHMVNSQIIAADPTNNLAAIFMARIQIKLFLGDSAKQSLTNIRPTDRTRRQYLMTWAEYHQLVGEDADAKQIYRELLARNPLDHEVRLAFGALYEKPYFDYEPAKAEYAKIPASDPRYRRARLGIANSLNRQRRFAESTAICQQLLAVDAKDPLATAQIGRNLIDSFEFDKAIALLQGYLDGPHVRPQAEILSVRVALGTAMIKANKPLDAIAVFESALARPRGKVPSVIFGLSQATERAGDKAKAGSSLSMILSHLGGDARQRVQMGELYQSELQPARAADMAQAVLKHDPTNLAALCLLGEAQLVLARPTADIRACQKTFEEVLKLSVTNIRGLVGLARARALLQDYRGAFDWYQKAITLDSDYSTPKREQARVLVSGSQYEMASGAYRGMQGPPAGRALENELTALMQRDPKAKAVLQPYVLAGMNGAILRDELNKNLPPPDPASPIRSASLTQPTESGGVQPVGIPQPAQSGQVNDFGDPLRRALLDFERFQTEHTIYDLEARSKLIKDVRPFESIPISKQLLDLEPSNQSAIFDLGQTYSTLKQTHAALDMYNRLLRINPLDREASIAAERATFELGPRLISDVTFFDQQGRDRLAAIQTTRWREQLLFPFGEEDEYFLLAFSRTNYVPKDDPPLTGSIYTFGGQTRCTERGLLSAVVNYEKYPNRINPRFTYDLAARYIFFDWLTGRASTYLENVLQSGESMRQDIYRAGGRLGLDFRPNGVYDASVTFNSAWYSDVNYLNEFTLINRLNVSGPPTQLRFVLFVDVLGYANQTVFGPNPSNPTVGAIHPYFAPDRFAFVEGRAEWTHWISRDYFVHSNQCYYSLQYGIGWDNQSVNYHSLRGLLNLDIRPWFSIGGEVNGQMSEVYRNFGAYGFMTIRFPQCAFACR